MRTSALVTGSLLLSAALCAQSPLTTTFTSDNGGSVGGAVYFDLQVNTGVIITGLDLNFSSTAGTAGSVDVYIKPGTYAGSEADIAAWSMVGTGSATSNGADVPTPVALASDIQLVTGSYGVALVANGLSNLYTNGTGTNQTYSTTELTLTAGSAGNLAFSGTPFTPRVVNTSISYTVGGSAGSQTEVPIPAFNRTFSGQLTRGFWFQAPTSFWIRGVRVPDETGVGIQCVEVNRMASAPPNYSSSIQPTQLFYANNQPSANILLCNVFVNQGDYIGVLGACGNSTMANSYGPTGAFTSHILGEPVTLTRLLCQANLSTSGGNQLCSSEPAYEVGRVELYVEPVLGWANAEAFGSGCGAAPLSLYPLSRPVLGMTVNAETRDIPAGSLGGVLAIGVSKVTPPVGLGIIGMPGCSLYVSFDGQFGFPVTGATAPHAIAIPVDPSLAGTHVYAQSLVVSPGVNPLGIESSNGLDWGMNAM